jgi:hypothetical protein
MTIRHLFGLGISALLALALYWFWQEGLTLVQAQLRGWPLLRSTWAEFGLMTTFFVTCLLLGFAQWLWDKLPGRTGDH